MPEESGTRDVDLLHQPMAQVSCRFAINGSSPHLGQFANAALEHVGGGPFAVEQWQGVGVVIEVVKLNGELPCEAPSS